MIFFHTHHGRASTRLSNGTEQFLQICFSFVCYTELPVSRNLWQRLSIVTLSILAGMLLLSVGNLILPEAIVQSAFAYAAVALLSAACGVALDAFWGNRSQSAYTPSADQKRLAAEVDQLNQEIFSQAQQQTAELSRLNLELQLQMAMVQQAVADTQTSEERFHNMADNIQEGLSILENGQVVYMNNQACAIFGDCLEGDLERRIREFGAPEEQPRLAEIFKKSRQAGRLPGEVEYWIIRKDGIRRCIRERYSQLTTGEVEHIFVVSSDITDNVEILQNLEAAVNDRTRELSTVLDVSYRIASTLELEPLLNLVLEQIQTILPYSGAAIFILEEERLRVATFQVPGLELPDQAIYLPMESSEPYKQVINNQQVLIIEDIQGDTPLLARLPLPHPLPANLVVGACPLLDWHPAGGARSSHWSAQLD